ncbi:hypothetical protein BT93_A0604 [Corymbia citriodora subsp. variegata]|nr:hypothetical protein BT93_A0604 [Corymbia citriodora subsp. variegata]
MEHLFILSPWTSYVWSDPAIGIQTSHLGLNRIGEWLLNFESLTSNSLSFELMAITLWNIWLSRNQAVFRKRKPKATMIVESALAMHESFKKWNSKAKILTENPKTSAVWQPPKQGHLKWNFDGSFVDGSTEGTITSICQDSSDKIVDGLTLGCLETLKCILSRSEAKKAKYIFEPDSFDLISFLSGSAQPSWEVAPPVT